MMSDKENWLRAIEFRNPEWIPFGVNFAPLTWHTYKTALEDIVLSHPLVFKGYQPGSVDFDNYANVYREGERYTDNWGCVWYNKYGGLEGQVIGHPLADWNALETYQPPDLLIKEERGDRDWTRITSDIDGARQRGELIVGNGERLFDRMYFLRGFENLMIDIATDDPHLNVLIDMLQDYELRLVDEWLKIGVDAIGFHTDIGTQKALMISPEKFRKYIKPMFTAIFQKCRQNNVHACLSSDGCVVEIVDDLIECGISMHDPQVRANTLDGIEKAYKGKVCVNLDLDRQMFAFCTPADIDTHVREAIQRMKIDKGGLMITASVWDDNTPLENIDAICRAVERYCLGV